MLRERALQATAISVVICDARLPDNPIVWVNRAFTDTTGYRPEEAIGRNPRFLQGPETDPAAIQEMGDSLRGAKSSIVTLINYRADGSTFWNSVSTAPVFDEEGAVLGYIGVQVDVTDRVLAAREREERLREERNARLAAEKAQRTLSLLVEVTERLNACMDVRNGIRSVADLLVPRFADGCAVDLVGEAGEGSGDPERVVAVGSAVDSAEAGDPALLGRVLRTARPVSIVDVAQSDAQSLLVLPLMGKGVLGALTLLSSRPIRSWDDEQLDIAIDITRRVAQAVDRSRLLRGQPTDSRT